MFDLMSMQIQRTMQEIKTTVLYRPEPEWSDYEIYRLCESLMTEVSGHPDYPNYLILYGHYTVGQIYKAWNVGAECIVRTRIGLATLPFKPSFI
jgi:hypothetical protein